jgi:hypothetical protein
MDELIAAHRQEILALAAKHGARNVRLFGSRARGEAGPQSDADFLVELAEDRDLFDLGGLLMDLQDLLHCPVETVTEEALHPRLKERVLREAVPL